MVLVKVMRVLSFARTTLTVRRLSWYPPLPSCTHGFESCPAVLDPATPGLATFLPTVWLLTWTYMYLYREHKLKSIPLAHWEAQNTPSHHSCDWLEDSDAVGAVVLVGWTCAFDLGLKGQHSSSTSSLVLFY